MKRKMVYINTTINYLYWARRTFQSTILTVLKSPFDDIFNKNKERGRDADAYYRSHHEIDSIIGNSLGGSVSLALEK